MQISGTYSKLQIGRECAKPTTESNDWTWMQIRNPRELEPLIHAYFECVHSGQTTKINCGDAF